MINILKDKVIQDVCVKISNYDGLDLAISFASLNTLIEQRDNINSIIILSHLSLMFAKGQKRATPNVVKECLDLILDSGIGRDDPHENIFVNNVSSVQIGNNYILEGIWNNCSFYTQKCVDVIEQFPQEKASDWSRFRVGIYSLLQLSNLMCNKANLKYNQEPKATDNKKIFYKGFVKTKSSLIFSKKELEENGIDVDSLTSFLCLKNDFEEFQKEDIGNTSLETRPLYIENETVYIVHPTAIPIAIVAYVIKYFQNLEGIDGVDFLHEKFSEIDRKKLLLNPFVLGGKSNPIDKKECITNRKQDGFSIENYALDVDKGVYFNLLLVFDPLDNVNNLNLLEPSLLMSQCAEKINSTISSIRSRSLLDRNFTRGYTLIVLCGFGRASNILIENNISNWDISLITDSDFYVLSWLDNMSAEYLFRVKDAEKAIQKEGVIIMPPPQMDLLNTIGCIRDNNNSLINHDCIGLENATLFLSKLNANRSLKYDVSLSYDVHVEQHPEDWKLMRIESRSYFQEDKLFPIYVDMDSYYPNLISINHFNIWIHLESSTKPLPKEERQRFINVWIKKTMEYLFNLQLLSESTNDQIDLYFSFKGKHPLKTQSSEEFMTLDKVIGEIDYQVDKFEKLSYIDFSENFDNAFLNAENFADQAVVFILLKVMCIYWDLRLTDILLLEYVKDIVGDRYARQIHVFEGESYRDYIQSEVQEKPLVISPLVVNNLKYGLAWRQINREEAPLELRDEDSCKTFLNNMVLHCVNEIRETLKFYNRADFIKKVFQYYEANAKEDIHWDRTLPAMLAIHENKQDVLDVVSNKKFKRNSGQRALRLLIEIALCECSLDRGLEISRLDLVSLMAKISFVEYFGNLSDTIFYQAIEPWIRITSLGDVHSSPEFENDIVEPFGKNVFLNHSRLSGEKYESLYKVKDIQEGKINFSEVLKADFLLAWEKDFGFPLEDLSLVIGSIEAIAIDCKERIIIDVEFDDLVTRVKKVGSIKGNIESVLDFLLLKTRSDWLTVPEGFQNKEVFPWLYRRRLSIIMKPILQIDNNTRRLLISVPFLRDAFGVIFHSYYYGTLRDLRDKRNEKFLHQWKGMINNKMGTEFNDEVAEKLRNIGWNAVSDIKVTQLLNKKFDIDYGDVDTLAWDESSGRILVIECKNLQFKKTTGEIAEQISAFRGKTDSKGKRDLLKRHLDRVDILRESLDILQSYLKINTNVKIESHIVFKSTVPMKYSMKVLSHLVKVHFFDELNEEFNL